MKLQKSCPYVDSCGRSSHFHAFVFSHPRGDPANLVPAQGSVRWGRQRIPRIHQSILPPSLCGAASVWWMLHQRGLLLHQHKSHACQQDSKRSARLHHCVGIICSYTSRCEDINHSSQLCNSLVCMRSHPTAVGLSLAAAGRQVNAGSYAQLRNS